MMAQVRRSRFYTVGQIECRTKPSNTGRREVTAVNIDSIMDALHDAQHSDAAFLKGLKSVGNALGFEHAAAFFVRKRTAAGSVTFVNTYSDKWANESSQIPFTQVLQDPVLKHLGARSEPIEWSEQDYERAKLGELYERFHPNGLGSGIAVAVRAPTGDYACLGFSNAERRIRSDLSRTAELGALFLSATASLNVFLASDARVRADAGALMKLTKREIECLEWCREGKTAWETSVILHIGQSTVTFHLKNAIFKLDAANKTHAVLRAVDLGLIL